MLSIKNYGHYWSRRLVDFGTRGRGNQGSLLGATKVDSIQSEADFRHQIAIYCLFDEDREVVYAGQTGKGNQRLLARLRGHSRGQLRDRWTNFSWFGFLDVDEKSQELIDPEDSLEKNISGTHIEALDEMEAVLLQVLEPRLNKQGPRWNAGQKKTVEYFQYTDFEDTDNDDLWEKLIEIEKLLKSSGRES